MRATTLAALLALAVIGGASSRAAAQNGLMSNPSDPAFIAAQEKARATLPEFLLVLREKSAQSFAVRAPVSHAEGRDQIWIVDVRFENGRFHGVVDAPRAVTGLSAGSAFTVAEADVTDWYYVRDGLMHGAFSVRAMLPRLPKDQAERLRKQLAW
jgi:uncharacterized protein YegJ (DUF2314 family)